MKATINTKKKEVVTVVEEDFVTLELTMEEAEHLKALCGRIRCGVGGASKIQETTSKIYWELNNLDVCAYSKLHTVDLGNNGTILISEVNWEQE